MQAQAQSLLFFLAVINEKDLVSSRCMMERKEEKREVTFLASSQVLLRASIFLSVFLCDNNKWRLGTSMAAAFTKRPHSDIQQNTDQVSHAFSKWPYVVAHFFHEIKTIRKY